MLSNTLYMFVLMQKRFDARLVQTRRSVRDKTISDMRLLVPVPVPVSTVLVVGSWRPQSCLFQVEHGLRLSENAGRVRTTTAGLEEAFPLGLHHREA